MTKAERILSVIRRLAHTGPAQGQTAIIDMGLNLAQTDTEKRHVVDSSLFFFSWGLPNLHGKKQWSERTRVH